MKLKSSIRLFLSRLILITSLAAAPSLFAETLDSVSHYGNGRLVADGGEAATVSSGGIPHGANFSGSASGNYTLTAGGADLWGGSDQGSFIYDDASGPRSGNFSAVVRMRVGEPGETLPTNWGRSGINARKDPLAANSANFAHYRIFAGDNANESTRLGVRNSDGAGTGVVVNGGSAPTMNDETQFVWLGLHRYGNQLATTWAPDNAGSPGAWSNFAVTGASADLQGPVYVGLAHQNHSTSGTYAPEGAARQISTGVFEQFQVTDFNPAFAGNVPVLPGPGVLPGPAGECKTFGVHEVRGPGGTLADAVTTLLTTPGASTAQLPKLDVTDPETNGPGGPTLSDPPIPYLTNTSGGDDDIKTSAKGRLKVIEAGIYTFNFHGDDGFAARVVGKDWDRSEGAGSIDLADPSVVFFPSGTGDHNTRATVMLEAGEHDFEYLNWEGGGGAYYEVTVAKGDLIGYQRANWIALGDPSLVTGQLSDRDVALTAPAVAYKFDGAAPASPNGDDASAPSRFGNVGDGGIRDNILNNLGTLSSNTQDDTIISSAETPAGNNDGYQMGVFGNIIIDNGNGVPGESIDISFRTNSDDGSQLRIIGQSFTAVAGDARAYIESIGGDAAITGDYPGGGSNVIGHITLVEGTYDFEAFMFEGAGGDKLELQWQPGHVTGGTWLPINQVLVAPDFAGIQLVDGTKSSVALSFTSDRDTAAILAGADAAGVPVDSTTGSAFVNWNSTVGLASDASASGTTAEVTAPMPGILVADTNGAATPTGITVDWSSANTWNTNNGTSNGDNKVMSGYLDNNAGNPDIPINLAGISSHFQDGYSVYVYIGSDGNGRTGTIENVGGVTYSYSTSSAQAGAFPGAYAQTTDTGAGNPAANYAVFSGLSGDAQSFVFHRGSSNSGAHGIQIVGVPHPAAMLVFDGPADTDPAISSGQPTPVDYGITPFGDTVTRTIGINNDGTRALVIPAGGATVGPGFTVLNNGSAITVQSGETFGLQIRFDATGDFTSMVSIETDCNNDVPFTFMLEGGVPPIIICPVDITVNAPTGGMSDPVNYVTTATDESGTPTLVCTPPSGSMFPIGVTVVNCTATDEAGNQSMASFNVIVLEIQEPEFERVLDVISLRGDDAVGAGGASGVPAGATIYSFNHAFINNDGGAIFEATLLGAGANNIGLFKGNEMGLTNAIAAKGGTAPSGGSYGGFDHLAIADDGTSSFSAIVGGRREHVTDDGTNGTGRALDAAPGSGGALFSVLQHPASASAGEFYSPANLRIGTGAPLVNALNDSGIWSASAGAPIVREGDLASGLAPATHGHLFGRVVTNSSAEIAFAGNLYGAGAANSAVWAGAPGSIAAVVQRLSPAPGTSGTFSAFHSESIGKSGHVAFRALLTPQSGVITSSNNEGIWTNRNGSLELIAREGDVAPCLPTTDALFSRFTQVYVAEDGTVCFFAFLKGTGVTSANDGSFWRSSPDGTLHIVVREGQTANSTAGSAIARLTSVSCNNVGGIVYVATLATGVGETVTANNQGLWLDQGAELAASLIVRKGDTFPLEEDDRTVTSIGFDYTTTASGGTGGVGRIINDSGDVMLKLSLDGNISGLFKLGTND